MNKKMLFKVLCLVMISLLISNIFIDVKLLDIPYLHVLLQAGIILVLVDFILKLRVKVDSTSTESSQNTQTIGYNFTLSKIGLSTILTSTLIQSLMF